MREDDDSFFVLSVILAALGAVLLMLGFIFH